MKKPFVLTGGACVAASFLLPIYGGWVSFAVLIGAIAIAFCLIPKNKRILPRLSIIAAILLLVGIRFVGLDLYIENKSEKLFYSEAEITGIVTDLSHKDNLSRFAINIEDSSVASAEGVAVVGYTFEHVDFNIGDRIVAEVKFVENDLRYKAADFDDGKYFTVKLKNYYLSQKAASPVLAFADSTRKSILKAVNSLSADQCADLLGAVIIGDKHSISVDLNEYVNASGTKHMLVVSGLHLGIVCGLVMKLLKKRVARKITVILMLSFLFLVTTLCLFHISILRAGIAYSIMLVGMLRFRNIDPLNSLGMATTLLVFLFPYSFYNVAFMLSIAATFGVVGPASKIISTLPEYDRRSPLLKRACRFVFSTITVAVCALVFTLPFTIYYFGTTSLIAPVSSLLLGFSVTGMLAAGVIGVAFWFIPMVGQIFSAPFILVAKIFASYFLFMVKLIAKSGIGFVDISPENSIYYGIFAIIFLVIVYTVCNYINSKKEIKPFAYRQDLEISP